MKDKILNRIKCFWHGHELSTEVWFSYNVQKIKCDRCSKRWGINHDIECVTKWNEELESEIKLIYPEKFNPK